MRRRGLVLRGAPPGPRGPGSAPAPHSPRHRLRPPARAPVRRPPLPRLRGLGGRVRPVEGPDPPRGRPCSGRCPDAMSRVFSYVNDRDLRVTGLALRLGAATLVPSVDARGEPARGRMAVAPHRPPAAPGRLVPLPAHPGRGGGGHGHRQRGARAAQAHVPSSPSLRLRAPTRTSTSSPCPSSRRTASPSPPGTP